MKRLLKKIGRIFIALEGSRADKLRQSVLLVDGSFILPNNLALIIKGAQGRFKNAHFVVLTFQDKKEFIKDSFPEVEVIVPGERIRAAGRRLALQLFLLLLKKRFRFIVLASLDISLVPVSLVFGRCPVILYNRWLEWYRIRRRTLLDILRGNKSVDKNRRRTIKGVKEAIKSCGRSFLILGALDDEDLRCRILIEDNGYTEVNHIINTVRSAQSIFINPDISLLTFASRKTDFINNFPQIKLVTVREGRAKYGLAMEMFRMRGQRFNYAILTALDISPLAVSFLFLRARILLYNRWYEWWDIGFRNISGYLKTVFIFLLTVPLYAYLFITGISILAATKLRMRLSDER